MRRLAALIGFLLIVPIIHAQGDCTYGQPCQGVPWRIDMPDIYSPTPIPTLIATATPSATPNVTPTPTDTSVGAPTATGVGVTGLNDQLGTLQSVMNATPITVDGMGFATLSPEELGTNSGTFLGYVAGLRNINLGFLQPAVVFVIAAQISELATTLLIIFLPVIARIWEFIRRIISTILEFIPG